MNCPNCGTPAKGKFCARCGTPIPAAVSAPASRSGPGEEFVPVTIRMDAEPTATRPAESTDRPGSAARMTPYPDYTPPAPPPPGRREAAPIYRTVPASGAPYSGPEIPASARGTVMPPSGKRRLGSIAASPGMERDGNSAQRILKSVFSSQLALWTAVFYTLYLAVMILVNIQIANEEPETSLLVTKVGLFMILTDHHEELENLVSYAFFALLPTVAIVTGLWITVGSAWKKDRSTLSTVGFSSILVILILDLIQFCIGMIIALGTESDAQMTAELTQVVSLNRAGEAEAMMILMIIGLLILVIIYYSTMIQVLWRLRNMTRFGARDRVPIYPAVYSFILAHDLLFLIVSFTQVSFLSTMGIIFAIVTHFLVGALLFRLRRELR